MNEQNPPGPGEISNLVTGKTTYLLNIALRHSDPPIWRTLKVSGDILLGDLHRVFQIAMGWFDDHLHEFRVGSHTYSKPTTTTSGEDENQKTLSQIAPRKGSRFAYAYDFGDNWQHDVVVEGIERGVAPVAACCLAGQNACPPEDSGGVFRYRRLLESLADPADPNYDESKEWVGEDFDPAYFDPDDVNAIFARIAEK